MIPERRLSMPRPSALRSATARGASSLRAARVVVALIALCLGVYENYRHHHMSHAIEKFGMLLGVLALIIFSFGFFGVEPFNARAFTAAAGVMFAVGAILIIKALGPMMGPVGVLEVLSLGGNIVSYARLMALGLAAIAIKGAKAPTQ